jgi:hypothetical protein
MRLRSIPTLLAASQHKRMTYTDCCIYRIVPPDDEQQACSKHVEVNLLKPSGYVMHHQFNIRQL